VDKHFRAFALNTSFKSFGKAFPLKDDIFRSKELRIVICGRDRRRIPYYSKDKAERDRKSRGMRLAKVKQSMDAIASSLWSEGRRRRPTKKGVEEPDARLMTHSSESDGFGRAKWRI
jgi:hypothetical protein